MAEFKSVITIWGQEVWYPGNDGTGSGLDADLLRGLSLNTGAVANTVVQRDASGNITANAFIGDGSQLTNISSTAIDTSANYNWTGIHNWSQNATFDNQVGIGGAVDSNSSTMLPLKVHGGIMAVHGVKLDTFDTGLGSSGSQNSIYRNPLSGATWVRGPANGGVVLTRNEHPELVVAKDTGNILLNTTVDNLSDTLQVNGTSTFDGSVSINTDASSVPFSVNLAPAQTANAFEVNSSGGSGGNRFVVDSSGGVNSSGSRFGLIPDSGGANGLVLYSGTNETSIHYDERDPLQIRSASKANLSSGSWPGGTLRFDLANDGVGTFYNDFNVQGNVDATSFTGDGSGLTNISSGSHNHDNRYYTETEADNRFVNVSGDTMTGNLDISGQIEVVTSSYPVMDLTLETSDMSNYRGAVKYTHKTSQSSASNGLGIGFDFGISTASNPNPSGLGYVGAIRDGADDRGKIIIGANDGGFTNHQYEFGRDESTFNIQDFYVNNDGYARITTTSQSNSFSVRSVISGRRSRSSETAVQNNDRIFSFIASGHDGSEFKNSAAIDFDVAGSVATNNVPIDIAFATGSNGTRTNRLTVKSSGNILIGTTTDNGLDKLQVNGTADFTGHVTVPYEIYGSSWNTSDEVPTKSAIYGKIETINTDVQNHNHDDRYIKINDDQNYERNMSTREWNWIVRQYNGSSAIQGILPNLYTHFLEVDEADVGTTYVHTDTLDSVSYITPTNIGLPGGGSYHMLATMHIHVHRPFSVVDVTFSSDDEAAIYINGKPKVSHSDNTSSLYSHTFTTGWHRIDLLLNENGGLDFVSLGWNPKDYLAYIDAMTPFGPNDFIGSNVRASSFEGDGNGLTNLNATQILTGLLDNARTTGTAGSLPNTLMLRDDQGDTAVHNINTVNIQTSSLSGSGSFFNITSDIQVNSGLQIFTNVHDQVPLSLRGANNQSANIQEWKTYDGTAETVVARVDSSGVLHGDGSGLTNISAGSHSHDDRYYTETEADNRFINSSGDTMSGNLDVGTTETASNRRIRVLSADTNKAGFEAYGNNQGTGYLYVGQDPYYGGGIEYNGDSSPLTSGGGNDYLVLWRRNNGTDDWTARNLYSNNDWEFRGDVSAATFTGDGSGLTNLNASQLSSGTVPAARLPDLSGTYLPVTGGIITRTVNSGYDSTHIPLTVRVGASDATQVANGFGSGIEFNATRTSGGGFHNRTGWVESYLYSGAQTSSDRWALRLGVRDDDTERNVIDIHPNSHVQVNGSATFSGQVSVPEEAYSVDWNGSISVPTKNAVYDKISLLESGLGTNHNHDGRYYTESEIDGFLSDKANLAGGNTFTGTQTISAGSSPATNLYIETPSNDGSAIRLYNTTLSSSVLNISRTGDITSRSHTISHNNSPNVPMSILLGDFSSGSVINITGYGGTPGDLFSIDAVGSLKAAGSANIGGSNILHDDNFDYSNAKLSIFEIQNNNGGNTPASTRDILHLVREGVESESYGNMASFAIGRYENNSSNSRTQLDIKLTDGSFDPQTVMSLRANGNVGIGTTSPSRTLVVEGDALISTGIETSSGANNYFFGDSQFGEEYADACTFIGTSIFNSSSTFNDTVIINETDASSVPLSINLAAAQTANSINITSDGGTAGDIFNITTDGDVFANSFSGSGSGLTDINGSNITSGTISSDRIGDLSSSYLSLSSGGTVSGDVTFTGIVSFADAEIGVLTFPENGGETTWTDMAVTSSSPSGTENSYAAQIDGNPVFKVYGESDGSGGVQNLGTVVRGLSSRQLMSGYTTRQAYLKTLTATTSTLAEIEINTNEVITIEAMINGVREDFSEGIGGTVVGTFIRNGSIRQIGSIERNINTDNNSWSFDIDYDNALHTIRIRVTSSNDDMDWVGTYKFMKSTWEA